jgi:hypothetical protein
VQNERPVRQRFLVDFEADHAPIRKQGDIEPELQALFQKVVVNLEVLRRQEHSFRPDDAPQVFHSSSSQRKFWNLADIA